MMTSQKTFAKPILQNSDYNGWVSEARPFDDKPTVDLRMIVKDERDAVGNIIASAIDYFDAIHITVSHKPTANFLRKVSNATPNVHIYYRDWNDDFGAARTANWEKGEAATYSFWLDADDYFDFTAIPGLVSLAESHAYDAVYLPYNYAQDEYGNCIARHWRERLVRRSVGFTWHGRVHETLITGIPFTSTRINAEVVHRADHIEQSHTRNHAILVNAVQADPDPRYLHYLGLSYFARKEYKECIEILRKFVNLSGWDEEIYRSFVIMSEAAYQNDDMNKATEFAMKAMAMFPSYPQAFWLMAQYENDQDNYAEALRWAEVADKTPLPDTMSIIDPTCVDRNRLIAAQACFMLDRHLEAYKWLKRSNDPNAIDLLPDFEALAETETFFKLLPKLRPFFKNDTVLFDGLSRELQYDKRARGLRNLATKPKDWNDKSLVILCGKGYEEWGPQTLDKGMGGSEEAVVYLSREMARLGYDVTVYAEANLEEMISDKDMISYVHWRPWQEFDPRDEFNVFVAWRAPAFAEQVNARIKLVDVHDVLPDEQVVPLPDVTYMFKSQYHRNLYPQIDDAHAAVIGNGISKEQFNA